MGAPSFQGWGTDDVAFCSGVADQPAGCPRAGAPSFQGWRTDDTATDHRRSQSIAIKTHDASRRIILSASHNAIVRFVRNLASATPRLVLPNSAMQLALLAAFKRPPPAAGWVGNE